MKQHRIALLTATCATLFALPANAYVVVIGNQLAHDCYISAKTGVDLPGGIATCTADGKMEVATMTGQRSRRAMISSSTAKISWRRRRCLRCLAIIRLS